MYGWIESRPMRNLKALLRDWSAFIIIALCVCVGGWWAISGLRDLFNTIPDATPLSQIPWGKAKDIVFVCTLAALVSIFRK